MNRRQKTEVEVWEIDRDEDVGAPRRGRVAKAAQHVPRPSQHRRHFDQARHRHALVGADKFGAGRAKTRSAKAKDLDARLDRAEGLDESLGVQVA